MRAKSTIYWLLSFSILYFLGMLLPLMENDSAQFAVMASRMVVENDFTHLYKGSLPYLDKPHLHYWLSAISMKLFGIHAFSYRLPGVLLLFAGAYFVFKTTKLLYDERTAHFSGLVFIASQTIILAGFDLRTDAVLTGLVAWAIYHLTRYIYDEKLNQLLWGALIAGFAFATKGLISIVVIGGVVLALLNAKQKWGLLFRVSTLGALLVFLLSLTPVLFAYYIQFDLHPELVVRGVSNRSGIKFLFWEQSFERLSGKGHGKTGNDPLFFFHTFLWAFMPFSLVGIVGLYKTFRSKSSEVYVLRSLTVALVLLLGLMSLAQFKLPHYLNVLLPLITLVFTPAVLRLVDQKIGNSLSVLTFTIYGIASVLICIPFYDYLAPGVFLVLILLSWLFHRRSVSLASWLLSGVLAFNLLAFTVFYPKLLDYQSDISFSKRLNLQEAELVNATNKHTWNLDFFFQTHLPERSVGELVDSHETYVLVDIDAYQRLKSLRPDAIEYASAPHYRVTKLSLKFLSPKTRPSTLEIRRVIWLP